jgi:hypothetical protein
MINLKDTTFIIPITIESNDRLKNAKSVLGYLNHHFNTNIIIHELTKDVSKLNFIENLNNLKIEHIVEINPLTHYHRTRQLNYMLNMVNTPVVANYDIDVVLPISSYIDSQEMIYSNKSDFVYPYGYGNYQKQILENFPRNIFEINFNIDDINNVYLRTHTSGFGHCFFGNTEKYILAGGENEDFIAYGPEDAERAYRFEKLGFSIGRIDDFVYHFEHMRTPFSCGQNGRFYDNNLLFDKILKMNHSEFLEYYKNPLYTRKYDKFYKRNLNGSNKS